MAERGVERRGAPLPMLLLPVLFGILVYLATLSGSFLSDDYLVSRFVGSDGSMLWGQAFRDFGGPWGGFEAGLYRPLISLSLCVDTMLGGGGPAAFHATNLLFHCISIYCVAWLCGRYARQRKALLSLLAGSLFALSPVGVEAVAWILGRVSSQEVAFRLVALCCFTLWLEERRAGRYLLTAVFAMAALLSKESAVVLPLAFLGLDLLHGGRGRALIQRQLLFVPIWILYAGLRLNALSTGGARSAGDLLAAFPASVLPKAQSLLLAGFDSPILTWALVGFLVLFLMRVSYPCARERWPWIVVALLLWFLQFLPSAQIQVGTDLSGSRILYGPLAMTLILVAAGLGLPARGLALGFDWLLTGLLLMSLPFLGKATDRRISDCEKAWALVDGYRTELQARVSDSRADRPMTLLSAPADGWGIPLLRADTMFSLLEPPFLRRPGLLLSLIPVFRALPEQKELYFDVLPLRSLWEQGAPLLTWDGSHILKEQKPRKPQVLAVERVSDRSYLFVGGSVNPYAFDGLQLEIEGEAVSLQILLPEGVVHGPWQTLKIRQGPGRKGDARKETQKENVPGEREENEEVAKDNQAKPGQAQVEVYRLDLSHDHLPLVASYLGGIAGFELIGKGKLLSLSVVRRFASFEDGLEPSREITLDAEGQLSVIAPVLPANTVALRFYLIGPYGGLSMTVEPGQPIRLEPNKARVLRSSFLLGSQRSFYLFFEARPKPGHWPMRSTGTTVLIHPR